MLPWLHCAFDSWLKRPWVTLYERSQVSDCDLLPPPVLIFCQGLRGCAKQITLTLWIIRQKLQYKSWFLVFKNLVNDIYVLGSILCKHEPTLLQNMVCRRLCSTTVTHFVHIYSIFSGWTVNFWPDIEKCILLSVVYCNNCTVRVFLNGVFAHKSTKVWK